MVVRYDASPQAERDSVSQSTSTHCSMPVIGGTSGNGLAVAVKDMSKRKLIKPGLAGHRCNLRFLVSNHLVSNHLANSLGRQTVKAVPEKAASVLDLHL